MTPDHLIQKAREYIGTPFRFGGRLKHIGVDCGGLILCAVTELGLSPEAPTNYTRQTALQTLQETLNQHCQKVETQQPGDILLFATKQLPGHCGILTAQNTFIHAYDSPSVSQVTETPLDARWQSRVIAVYRIGD